MSDARGHTDGPTADVSVRVGWADDAAGIAEVQVRAWRQEYAGLLPAEVLDSLDPEQFAAAWHASLNSPKDARNRVLVALERNTVRGFAVTGPAADPDVDPIADGEVSELTVDPDQTRHGHGSRLCRPAPTRCAPTGSAPRVVWLNSDDDVRRAFLTGAGWAPDGAHRELDLHGDGSVRVKQVRLHTDLAGLTPGFENRTSGNKRARSSMTGVRLRGLEQRAPARTDHWRTSCWVRFPRSTAPRQRPRARRLHRRRRLAGVHAPDPAARPDRRRHRRRSSAAVVVLLLLHRPRRPTAPVARRRPPLTPRLSWPR